MPDEPPTNEENNDKDDHAAVVEQAIEEYGIARLGNGDNQEISYKQWKLIESLYNELAPQAQELLAAHDTDFFHHDTCRRYLVARQWNYQAAQAQLLTTLQYRHETDPAKRAFWESPKCLANPLAMNMRIVGWDDVLERPIACTCFRQAHDRYNAADNMVHVELLLEAMTRLIHQKRKQNTTAESRQAIWVIDFDGFGLWDQNPKSSVLCARLLQHYPEMLNTVILLNAPTLFNGLWRLVAPLLDERVRAKVVFVNAPPSKNTNSSSEAQSVSVPKVLIERLGEKAARWIWNETLDNQQSIPEIRQGRPKQYWIPPTTPEQHDARGMADYVQSPLYVKTPGDAYQEQKDQDAAAS